MKVDTGADTCVLTTDDLQRLGLSLDIKPCTSALKSYGGNPIENLGATNLQIAYKSKSISAKFNVVEAPEHPLMIGYQQAQELGIITVNLQELHSVPAESSAKPSIQHANLFETAVMRDYQDRFH